MQDIQGEETQLRDGTVDRAVSKPPGILEPADIRAQIVPGDILRGLAKDVVEIVEVGTDIGAVIFEGMRSKTTQGDHLPERIQVIVHNKISFEM